jgi:hypothetical protein
LTKILALRPNFQSKIKLNIYELFSEPLQGVAFLLFLPARQFKTGSFLPFEIESALLPLI